MRSKMNHWQLPCIEVARLLPGAQLKPHLGGRSRAGARLEWSRPRKGCGFNVWGKFLCHRAIVMWLHSLMALTWLQIQYYPIHIPYIPIPSGQSWFRHWTTMGNHFMPKFVRHLPPTHLAAGFAGTKRCYLDRSRGRGRDVHSPSKVVTVSWKRLKKD